MNYAIFNRPIVTIYDRPAYTKQTELGECSAVSDEGLCGQVCRVLAGPGGKDTAGEPMGDSWVEVMTFYGYRGYVPADELVYASESKLRTWLTRRRRLVGRIADVMNLPSVEGVRIAILQRGDIVERLPERAPGEPDNGLPMSREGWARVRLTDGREGYLRDIFLEHKRYSEAAVFYLDGTRSFDEALAMGNGVTPDKLVGATLDRYYDGSEEAFRANVTEIAKKYLGVQYRWGGKSSAGMDCSGLVSTCYMHAGVLIYRDAKIVEGWPVHEITLEAAKPGDLLYFPGHIAMYLGEGRYIHSTGFVTSGGVVINSLNPNDPLYRADLPEKLTAVGSIF